MTSKWIDFREFRRNLPFDKVLELYGVTIRQRAANRHQGPCPLPGHEGTSRSFSANLDKGVWQCFSCKKGGNALEFAAIMEGLNPVSGGDIRKAALILQEKLGIEASPVKDKAANGPQRQASKPKTPGKRPPDTPKPDISNSLPVIVNAPLDFELKNLDPEHPYLRNRGFTAETVQHFGLGYCSKGLFAGRIAIPIRDERNRLVGYAGRIVDDEAIDKEHPKYLLPGRRTHNGTVHEFHKSAILYNANAIQAPVKDLILVEGFASVWWLTQCGYPNVVAMMGWACSDEQATLAISLVEPEGRIWAFTDADQDGVKGAHSIFQRIAPHRNVRWLKIERGQPTDHLAETIRRSPIIHDLNS